MKRISKTTMAAMAGLSALALLAAPVTVAADEPAGGMGAFRLAHMGDGGYGGGQHMTGPGMMGPAMMGRGYHMGRGMMGPSYHMGRGMMGQGFGMGLGATGEDCPMQSAMIDEDQQMGPGMMGPGLGMAPHAGRQGMMGRGMRVVPQKDLTTDDVRHFLEDRLARHGNKRLKIGEIKQADDDTIVADVVTADNSLVWRFNVDLHTGRMQAVQ